MARISRRKVDEDVLLKLYRLFFEIVSRFEDQEDFSTIVDDILSPTEKIMVAKRVGIIYLLIKKVDYRDIVELLKVSTATVVFYAALFRDKNSRLINLIKTMLKKEKVLNFFDDLFADLMIHPGVYKGHWQMYWDRKRKQKERKTLG